MNKELPRNFIGSKENPAKNIRDLDTAGHFNLLNKNGKTVLSFWSYTGKCYVPSTGFSENIGIRNCIKKYKKLVGEDNE